MEEHEFLGTTLGGDVDGFPPMAVSPTAALGFVFLGQILGVINEHVGTFGEFADVAVKNGMAGLVVGGVNENSVVGFEAEAETSLGMIEPHGLHNAIVKFNPLFFHVVKIAMCRHLAHIDWEVGVGHLLLNGALQATSAAGGVEEKIVVGVLIKRLKEWNALDVIPVKVGEKDVGIDGGGTALGHEAFAEITESGSAIKDVNVVVDPDLHAGRVAAVLHVLQLRSWS